jgi:two-component system, LytTR family, sensor kinase
MPKSVKTLSFKVCIFLFLIFLSYRVYFWNGVLSAFLNASLDTLVSYFTGYVVYFYLENRLKSRMLFFVLSVVATIAVSFVLLRYLHYFAYSISGVMVGNFIKMNDSFGFQIFDSLTVIIIGAGITYSYIKNIESEINKKSAELLLREKNVAELRFLKNQIYPHFIFNTLNLIYFSIDKSNEAARSLLTSFSDLLRYQLYGSDKPKISFHEELDFIEKYLHIYGTRMRERISITQEIELPQNDFKFPPLLLIPFIENAMKHCGNKSGEKCQVAISIKTDEKELKFKVSNTKGSKPTASETESGIGISNVKKRLELLYGADFKLDIDESETLYSVALTLPI